MPNKDFPAAVASPQPCARDIDALVHERIMGMLPVRVWIATSDGGKSCCLSDESRRAIEIFLDQYKAGMARGYSLGSWDRYPLYTEDPTASKMLRDKMRADGWCWNVRWRGDQLSPVNGLYFAEFWRGDSESHCCLNVTEEFAIAGAALLTVGVDVEVLDCKSLAQALPDGGTPQAKKENK